MNKVGFSFLQPFFLLAFIFMVSAACHEVKKEPIRNPDFKEHVFVVNIVPDPQKLHEYLDYHAHIWPEVEAGFRKAGYRKISLYRYGYLLVMTIAVPEGADLGQMGKVAESYDKRCGEWNKLMDGYQSGVPGTQKGEKWVEAKPFYSFPKEGL